MPCADAALILGLHKDGAQNTPQKKPSSGRKEAPVKRPVKLDAMAAPILKETVPAAADTDRKSPALSPQEEPAFPVGARVDVLSSDDSVLLTGTIAGKEQGSLAACS